MSEVGMTDPQKEATQAGVDIWKSLPRSLQAILLFAALGGVPTVTQFATVVPRVAAVEAQVDSLVELRSETLRLSRLVDYQRERTDSVDAALRDANSKLTYILCQDRFRTLPNAREVCQTVQAEVESILRRGAQQP